MQAKFFDREEEIVRHRTCVGFVPFLFEDALSQDRFSIARLVPRLQISGSRKFFHLPLRQQAEREQHLHNP
jgi:hypothetical protein